MKKLNGDLEGILHGSQLPETEGLVLLPTIRGQVKQNTRVHKFSSLPLYKRGRKRLDSKYRNRVGKRADALRKVSLAIACIFF